MYLYIFFLAKKKVWKDLLPQCGFGGRREKKKINFYLFKKSSGRSGQ